MTKMQLNLWNMKYYPVVKAGAGCKEYLVYFKYFRAIIQIFTICL